VATHPGCKVNPRFFHIGIVSFISTETGVQQGDPMGSTLFALALPRILAGTAESSSQHADNVVISGPLSHVFSVQEAPRLSMIVIGLHLDPTKSEIVWILIYILE
jgi:hypothetical protein